jgi:hypothetical protein
VASLTDVAQTLVSAAPRLISALSPRLMRWTIDIVSLNKFKGKESAETSLGAADTS